MMWRAFVYGNGMVGKEDRARQAADTFLALDGKFDQNVVIQVGAVHSTVVLVLTTDDADSIGLLSSTQVKNGPMDFQVREPVSPLLTGLLPNTNVMMEVQAAQEYTGQAGESPTASRDQ